MPERPEFDLIQSLKNRSQFKHPWVSLGIGDDAAILSGITPDEEIVITTDTVMEGIDFITADCGPYLAGRKALAVNLSDLAAMAAVPVAGFVSLVLPKTFETSETTQLLNGIYDLADKYKMTIAGGDTNSWYGPLVITITALGKTETTKSIKRSTARPGDLIAVSGTLGGSIKGHHLEFLPRIELAQQLKSRLNITSMIDLSDGLSGDLQHILKASDIGAVIFANQIPVSQTAHTFKDHKTPLEHALHDGEDFELLFTFPPSQQDLFNSTAWETKLTVIGQIQAGSDYLLQLDHGEKIPMEIKSWSH